MKLFNLLFLVITLVTLQRSIAKEVAFPDKINGNGKILIDGKNQGILKGCRYNDAGRVFCEVYFTYYNYITECVDTQDPKTIRSCHTKTKYFNEHYRILIGLTMSGKCDLSKETKFKEVKLTYNYKGKDNYAQLIAECGRNMYRGYLPSDIKTYKGLRYRFTFITTKNCTFKGEFSNIRAYSV